MRSIRTHLFIATAAYLVIPAIATAQYHHSADCADGSCNVNTANFGYYQTGWRRWPTTATASSFVEASPTDNLDSLPAAETPDPRFEGDISPPPLREPMPANITPPSSAPTDDLELPPLQLPAPESMPDQSRQLPAIAIPRSARLATTVEQNVPRFQLIAKPLVDIPTASEPSPLPDESATETAVKLSDAPPQPIVPVSWENPLRSAAPTVPATQSLPIDLPPLAPQAIPEADPLPVAPSFPVSPASYEDPTRAVSPVAPPSTNPLRSNLPPNPLRDRLDYDDGQLRNPLRTDR